MFCERDDSKRLVFCQKMQQDYEQKVHVEHALLQDTIKSF